jgi:hypothetical protein
MAYQIIAEARNLDELRYVTPNIDDIPAGSVVNIHVNFAEYLNAEEVAREWNADIASLKAAMAEHIQVTRVSGSLQSVDIEGIVTGSPVIAVIAVIIVGLSVLGIVYVSAWAITKIVISCNITKQITATAKEVEALAKAGYSTAEILSLLEGQGKVVKTAGDVLAKTTTPSPSLAAGLGIPGWALAIAAVLLAYVLIKK